MSARTIGLAKLTATVAAAGTAVPLSATDLYTTDIEIFCKSANVGNIYIGDSTVDNTWIPRAPGSDTNITTGSGSMASRSAELGFNLKNIYINAGTNGDGVIVEYMVFNP